MLTSSNFPKKLDWITFTKGILTFNCRFSSFVFLILYLSADILLVPYLHVDRNVYIVTQMCCLPINFTLFCTLETPEARWSFNMHGYQTFKSNTFTFRMALKISRWKKN